MLDNSYLGNPLALDQAAAQYGMGGSAQAPSQAPSSIADQHLAYVRQYASHIGLDPNYVARIAQAEGVNSWSANNPNAASSVDIDPATGKPFSFGDFQLNMRNGLGTDALALGINAADPKQWQTADKYAMDQMKKKGYGPWKNDAAVKAGPGGGAQSGQTSAQNWWHPAPAPAPSASASAQAAAPTAKTITPETLRTLMLLKNMFPQHLFKPIDYNPYAVMPKVG